MAIDLPKPWLNLLEDEFNKPYMKNLRSFLVARKRSGAVIFPPTNQWFNAFKRTLPQDIKAVILGQDPYHGVGQANGLCFSVNKGIMLPPSLRNIFQELQNDLGISPLNGDLSSWADQGVLLLNATLTVEQSQAGAHQKRGWEEFTDHVLQMVSEQAKPSVFILWGAYAGRKAELIDSSKHLIIKAPHPSPLSAHRGFFGGRYFSRTNQFLQAHNREPINWSLD